MNRVSEHNHYHRLLKAAITVLFLLICASTGYSQEAMLIRLNPQKQPVVESIDLNSFEPTANNRGILVYATEGQAERWKWVDEKSVPPFHKDRPEVKALLSATTRGFSTADAPASFGTTVQLAQLQTGTLLRGSSFLTPMENGVTLNRQPTFRRLPSEKKPAFPAKSAVLLDSNNKTIVTIPFAEGQGEVRWKDIPKKPAAYTDGLTPGRYSLRLDEGLHQFTLLSADEQAAILAPIVEMSQLTTDTKSPLLLQFQIEILLQKKNPNGVPQFLADALDAVDASDEKGQSAFFRGLKTQLRQWLENLAKDPNYSQGQISGTSLGDATGVADIDTVRELIAAGRWTEAEQKLKKIQLPANAAQLKRMTGLQAMYGAVISSEAGLGMQDEAETLFAKSLELLGEDESIDLARAQINYGNFLLRQAQDRLNNHAFQIATGVRNPFLSALGSWRSAQENYHSAFALSQKLNSAKDAVAAQIRLAHLYAMLADLTATLNASAEDQVRFKSIQQSAAQESVRWAKLPIADMPGAELVRGSTAEIQAHLAFRAADRELCQSLAKVALAEYALAGYLAGAESVERLLGLNAAESGDALSALKHLKISHLLSELLRERFPQDQVGLSRAGFFSRRSYVNERIVELLIASNQATEALRFAELAKARAVQDLLTTEGLADSPSETSQPRELSALLKAWPKDVVALEYFLGERKAFVFVIDTTGTVKAFPIVDEQRQPVASRDLVARLRGFLNRIENQASKMANSILSGRGMDNTWQSELHAFYRQLIPTEAVAAMRTAKQVVIVPHHILHYFPFAALVVQPDQKKRSKLETVSPKFLVDESFDLIYAPSLTVWDLLHRRPARAITRAQAMGIVEVPGAPPLPGVAKDLENFSTVFGSLVKKVVQGEDAHETTAKNILGDPGVLLLATHGFNEPDHPLDSYLLFLPPTDAEKDNAELSPTGQLTARTICTTKVRSSMVVMSACFSGLGDRSPLPGDDLFGLQRAFLQAGARTVVSGLWDVYDGTAPELIQGYFKRVAAGKPASHALAESQREFLTRLRASEKPEPYLHPYFWAVYTVAGDDTVISSK